MPYAEILNILKEHNWDGYLLSEYEGADKYDPGYEVGQMLRRHHILMKNIWANEEGNSMEKQVIQSVGFRNIYQDGKAVGFQLKIRLPYYRGVFLSQIKAGSLVVDGETFTRSRSSGVWAGRITPSRRCGRTGTPIGTPWLYVYLLLAQGYHDIQYGFCVTHSYMPPFLESTADPNKPEMVYMPEMGHNLHQRRLLMV